MKTNERNPRINQGGPAFPVFVPHPSVLSGDVVEGMSLRDYFIAHAPAEPQPWFKPKVQAQPVRNEAWRWCDSCANDDGQCTGKADCAKLRANTKENEAWTDERDRQRWLQWPAAWANAMLVQKEREL